jgi:tetratricopeptide (TPR) repeat protein
MKRAAILGIMLAACMAYAQQQTPPQQTTTPPAGQQPGAQTAPPAKHPLQAKTQPEFDAYKAATGNANDPAAMEKAADDFAAKFPDSELRAPLYKMAMQAYQNSNNSDKMMEMGRKILKIDGDDPAALIGVAQVLAERTRDTDLDKDQRYDEAKKMAERSLQTIDTDIIPPPGTPPDKLEAYKNMMRSWAYSILGTVAYDKEDYPTAETNFQKSIEVYASDPDPYVVLKLALALDKQKKYPEALAQANKAVSLTQDGTPAGKLARQEKDRLTQLTGGSAPAAPKSPAGDASQPKQ